MKPIRIVLSPTRSRPLNILLGLVLLLVSLLLVLALATYHVSDPSLNTATDSVGAHAARNWVGLFGAYVSDILLQSIGVTAFLLPLWMGGIAWAWMHSRPGGSPWLRWMGIVLSLVFLPAVLGLMPWGWRWMHEIPVEGVAGKIVASLMVRYLNVQGSWIVAGVLAATGLYFASALSLMSVWESVRDRWLVLVSWSDRWRNWREERAELREEMREESRKKSSDAWRDKTSGGDLLSFRAPKLAGEPERLEEFEPEADRVKQPNRFFAFFRRKRAPEIDPLDEIPAFQRLGAEHAATPMQTAAGNMGRGSSIWERTVAEPAPLQAVAASNAPELVPVQPQPVPSRFPMPSEFPAASQFTQESVAASRFEERAAEPFPTPAAKFTELPVAFEAARGAGPIAIHERADAEVRTATVAPKHVSGFKLPPSTLLTTGDGPQIVREEALRDEAKVLEEKCAEFQVRGQVVQINPGPMVTTYEFKPEAGVKYSRVTGMADDLCLAMRAESILIERMAGKSTVGIQVPNFERETIHLRDVIESENFSKAKSRLTLSMGKDINGRIVIADLASMPHVLIAGSTGSGKSVAINAMIMSLLYRTTPSQVRLILVDPKRVELGMYEGVPHLFTPIITEPKLAANALRNAVREMERRLKLLASRSVRNIDQYNKLFEGAMQSLFDDGEPEEPLPYIVIIIDELADLMMLDRSNVEESITRLAQMARAVGIHLVLATQRPSVDVITGLIKANVPTRISFRLATKVDSRTILDTNGAESLLGRGDMLFLPPGTSRLMRLHAPYVSEKETAAVVNFWKEQGQAEYVEGFLESPKDEQAGVEGSNSDPGENDPMFDDAVRLVFEFGKASTSLLQRRLRIGYGRAAHLIDLMERDGLVGGADGSRPRELLKAPGWLHEVAVGNE